VNVRRVSSLAFGLATGAACLLGSIAPAKALVINFDNLNFPNPVIPSSYGSTANTTVSYKTINPDNNTVLTNNLGFWTTGYSQLNRVAYPLFHGALGEIAFTANAGYQVTLNSFNLGAYNQTNRNNTILRILDGVGNELFNPFSGGTYTVHCLRRM
jgi:hypothetical protein